MHFRPEDIKQMLFTMTDKHKGYMHSVYLNWQILKVTHPRYEGKIDQLVPLIVIDFK